MVGMTVVPIMFVTFVICASVEGEAAARSEERETVVEIGIWTPASRPRAKGFHTQRKPMRGLMNHVLTSTDSVFEPTFAALSVVAAESD